MINLLFGIVIGLLIALLIAVLTLHNLRQKVSDFILRAKNKAEIVDMEDVFDAPDASE